MNRVDIIKKLSQFFDIEELVCNHTFKKWGDRSWQFLDTEYLHTLLILRTEVLNAPMWCNGNGMTQRGLRCNVCELVKTKPYNYLSAHVLGKGGDFTITGMSAEQARNLIRSNIQKFPYPIRLEKAVSWLHIDVLDTNNGAKLVEFDG